MFAAKVLFYLDALRYTDTHLDVFQLGFKDLPAGRAPGLLSPFTH
jgi:hypothetical protein